LHRDIEGYNDNGISIRYVFFPRSGPATESWRKAQDVWCADSRQDALTKAKNDQDFSTKKPCDASMIAEHYKVVQELGLTGTPALLTQRGKLIVGYRTPDELLDILDDDM
jgi:thiol:disulfide interchange protein DsbC